MSTDIHVDRYVCNTSILRLLMMHCRIDFLLCSLKIFVPIAVLAFIVLVPVNWTSGTLENEKSLSYDQIDKLSISNLGKGSKR